MVLLKDFKFPRSILVSLLMPRAKSCRSFCLVSKKKRTMNIQCSNKDARPEMLDISLASGKYVNVMDVAWKCNEENIDNMGKGKGDDHCQIKRGDLNKSEMTVKYKCSNPPRRDFDAF